MSISRCGKSVFMIAVVLAAGQYAAAQTCDGDANGDSSVNVSDLLLLLSAWGPCDAPCPPCAEDFNGDCTVNVTDLLTLLAAWGPCPEPCDPNGTWVADPPISYSCFFGFIVYDIQTLTLSQDSTTLSVTGAPSFHTFAEVVMTGDAVVCGFGEPILVTAFIPGTCNETYTLDGAFITDDQFVATLTIEFDGPDCVDCTNQELSVAFNRQ